MDGKRLFGLLKGALVHGLWSRVTVFQYAPLAAGQSETQAALPPSIPGLSWRLVDPDPAEATPIDGIDDAATCT